MAWNNGGILGAGPEFGNNPLGIAENNLVGKVGGLLHLDKVMYRVQAQRSAPILQEEKDFHLSPFVFVANATIRSARLFEMFHIKLVP